MRFVVQTYFHIFLYDGKIELYGFQPLTVRLAFFIDMDFGNDWFMQTVNQQIIVLLNKVIIISGAVYFFCFASAVSNLTAINRIFQYPSDKRCIKQRIFAVLSLTFLDAVIVKIWLPY